MRFLFYIGNKKGMDHLVKYVSAFCVKTRTIKTHLLDIDQTGATTMDGTEAIIYALKKLGVHGNDNDTFKICGSTTDSGGEMTLKGLANPLIASKVADPDMLIANCTFRCVQLQLSNPVILLIGEGGLGKQNIMQLLHS
jgi:hypothetical protein